MTSEREPIRREAYRAWQLLVDGHLKEAHEALSCGIAAYPDDLPFRMNRSTCSLAMGRADAALEDLRALRHGHPDWLQGSVAVWMGVVLWWLGCTDAAVGAWREALVDRDAFGGVEAPSLLYFAAVRMQDRGLRREAVTTLRRRWKPRMAKVWPSVIMGFLLERLNEETFLRHQTFLNATLEARRLARAHFWVGVRRLEQDDPDAYERHLLLATERSSKEDGARLLEEEYWLALAETRRLPDRS